MLQYVYIVDQEGIVLVQRIGDQPVLQRASAIRSPGQVVIREIHGQVCVARLKSAPVKDSRCQAKHRKASYIAEAFWHVNAVGRPGGASCTTRSARWGKRTAHRCSLLLRLMESCYLWRV